MSDGPTLTPDLQETPDPRVCPYPQCLRHFNSRSRRDRHVNDVHTKKTTFECPYCPRVATQKSNLKTHIKNKHPTAFAAEGALPPPISGASSEATSLWIGQPTPASSDVEHSPIPSYWHDEDAGAAYNALPEVPTDAHAAPFTVPVSAHLLASADTQNTFFGLGYPHTSDADVYLTNYPPAAVDTGHLGYGGPPGEDVAGRHFSQSPPYPARDVDIEAQVPDDWVQWAEPAAQLGYPHLIRQLHGLVPPPSPYGYRDSEADINRGL
ncbi:hypothetical protein BOTBODRAFT_43140 [Botryobasidium botryosum FD-172 SS1]|uniref:C2H2-type domain-containing protein n=1 Tax=Botryobasidium botryosum (strain FD-172 SS1) TaxID=930990 RepID=A0A067MZQ0_BOTB1|nr:hypothetical protein BOTBODRAFT_43140 [Botryobasidium botryosum FD-172 SS1]